MISVVHQGDQRYNIYRSGVDIGCITVSQNPYHDRHCYLNLGLTQFDPAIAKELFGLLRRELGRPLQVMLYASEEMHRFLIAGGFARRRRCYELEAKPSDWIAPPVAAMPLTKAMRGSLAYIRCCDMLYHSYCETHRKVSPLTAEKEVFCSDLPDTVFCHMDHGAIRHFAFAARDEERCELFYVGTASLPDFQRFAESLVAELFRECDSIAAECDDTDPAAMILKSLFALPDGISYDTYILDGDS